MNILFLALDVDFRARQGDAIHTLELARFLAARGNRIDLVGLVESEALVAPSHDVNIHFIPRASLLSTFLHCSAIARKNGSVIIYERRLSPKVSYAISRALHLPFVLELNGSEDEGTLLGRSTTRRFSFLRKFVRGSMVRRAAHVITVSRGIGEQFQQKYGVSPGKVTVVSNGVDTRRFVPLDVREARRRVAWSGGPWVTFVGNLVVWQGVDRLFRAVPILRSKHPSIRVAVVGDGMLRSVLGNLANDLMIADVVKFVGSVPHDSVSDYLGASDLCVAPFTSERNAEIGLSPLKIYEYLAAGRPVVATDVPGIREILEGSKAGVLVPPDDPPALAEGISQILSDPNLRRELSENARRFAVRECSWERTAEQVEQVLARVGGTIDENINSSENCR